MACRDAYKASARKVEEETIVSTITEPAVAKQVDRLLFGVDSKIQANDLLQNNIEEFEWVVRNKIYPNFYGRYLTGENCLTKEEIKFLHGKGCKIAPVYADNSEKQTAEQGVIMAKKMVVCALELDIPKDTAIFLEIGEMEEISRNFMRGFATVLMAEGYTPGFKANTDAKFSFDREYSSGMQTNKNVF